MKLSKKFLVTYSFLLVCFFALAVTSFGAKIDNNQFYLSALVDFPDDALAGPYNPQLVDKMMQNLKQMGVKRVYWIHYGDRSYEMLWKDAGLSYAPNLVATMKTIDDPITLAVKTARKYGLEIYAYIKPYETGLSYILPEGSPLAAKYGGLPHLGGPVPCVMKFTREHPEMRIKRRMTDIPENIDSIPVCRIRLAKNDDAETHIKKENIEIWTSPCNYKYTKKDVNFTFRDVIEKAPYDVIDWDGKVMTAKGAPVRVLYLEGLNLTDKYILITTDCNDGRVDFGNTGLEMLKVYGPDGKEIPITIAGWECVWFGGQNYRWDGLNFDTGVGRMTRYLDDVGGKPGFAAFCRGKNEYLFGALCESYPEVRKFWLGMVKECLDAGVDGVDFRLGVHSTHTDDPFLYGFNPPVIREYQRRYGVDILTQNYDPNLLAELRGEYYTEFLRCASLMIRSAGKKVQLHLDADRFRPNPPPSRYLAFTWNIKFDWEKWISEGLADEVTLRCFSQTGYTTTDSFLQDPFAERLMEASMAKNLPVHYNRYIRKVPPGRELREMIQKVREDGRFRSFVLYEVYDIMRPDPNGNVSFIYGDANSWQEVKKQFGN